MSTRYSVTVTLDPLSTDRVHRLRQLICNQCAAWAAEMFALHLPLVEFFRCDEGIVAPLSERLSRLAAASRRASPRFALPLQGARPMPGGILLDFAAAEDAPVYGLRSKVLALLQDTPGVAFDRQPAPGGFQGIYLLREARLPASVFAELVEFAEEMVGQQRMARPPQARRLQLLRYDSNATGEDWSGGQWAADLRWRVVESYPL